MLFPSIKRNRYSHLCKKKLETFSKFACWFLAAVTLITFSNCVLAVLLLSNGSNEHEIQIRTGANFKIIPYSKMSLLTQWDGNYKLIK